MQVFWHRLGREMLLVAVVASATLLSGISGCRSSRQPAVIAVDNNGPDPADANMAPVSMGNDGSQQSVYAYAPAQGSRRLLDSPNGRVLEARMNGVNQAQVQEYAQNAAPIERRAPQGVPAPNQDYPSHDQTGVQGNPQDGGYADQAAPDQGSSVWSDGEQDAYNQVTEEADTAPPPLPVYNQPPAPAPNYLWTPGCWNYAPAGYYWVPGAWVAAPYYGALWTPGYWGAWHHHYGYHPGYWGRYVGFYGGISYGFGYFGTGYHGGYWRGNDFYYNQAVNRVNTVNIRNVYNRSVVINNTVINHTIVNDRAVTLNRVSYNGGTGGIQARPSRTEVAAFHSPRVAPMTAQVQNQRFAAENRQQFFKQNGGRPLLAAAPRPFAADRVIAPAPQRQVLGAVRAGQMLTPQQGAARSGQTESRPGQTGTAEQQRGLYGNQGQRVLETQQRAQQTGALQQQRHQELQAQQQQRTLQEQQRGRNQLQLNQPGVDQAHNVQSLRQIPVSQQSQGVVVGRQQQAVQNRRAFDRQQQSQMQQQIPVQENPAAQQQRVQLEQQRSQQVQQLQQQRTAQSTPQQKQMQENPAAAQQQRFAEQQQRMQLEQQRSQQSQQVQQQRAAQQVQQQRPIQENPAAQQQRFAEQQQQRMQLEQQRSQQVQQLQQQRAAQQQVQQQRQVQAEQQRSQPQQPRYVPQQPRFEAAPRQENRAAPQPQSQRRDGGRQH